MTLRASTLISALVSLQSDHREAFRLLDYAFLTVYAVEFLLKLYARPLGYWRSGYNVFDFIVLVMAAVQVIKPMALTFHPCSHLRQILPYTQRISYKKDTWLKFSAAAWPRCQAPVFKRKSEVGCYTSVG